MLRVGELGNVEQRLVQPVGLLFERFEAFLVTLALLRDSRLFSALSLSVSSFDDEASSALAPCDRGAARRC